MLSGLATVKYLPKENTFLNDKEANKMSKGKEKRRDDIKFKLEMSEEK